MREPVPFLILAILTAMVLPGPGLAVTQQWEVREGEVTLALQPQHLSNLGIRVADVRETSAPTRARAELAGSPLYSFRLRPGDELAFLTENGRLVEFVGGSEKAFVLVEGGLVFQASHPRTKAALHPAFLTDFALEIDPGAETDIVRIVSSDPALPVPLTVRNARPRFDWQTGELALLMGDLVLTKEWADLLEQPYLAGQWIGTLDLTLRAVPSVGAALAPEYQDEEQRDGGELIDVTLAELFDMTSVGHIGSYPTGTAGLASATTSCNTGQVAIPWEAPMSENHPFIGLVLFREQDGTLEMVGQNWIKHGFFALSLDDCSLGCIPTGGGTLGVGCSDVYSVGNNSNRLFLGPREEVDPYAASWEACGSFFDAEPVDCIRHYWGGEPNFVNHTLEVYDGDLGNPGAKYYYEGNYFLAGDANELNSIGWRECEMFWSGETWIFSTMGPGKIPNYGPLLYSWGDEQITAQVADDDGDVVLASQVTDLGAGQWHYEYALYNWNSTRGIHSFTIPTGSASISGSGFHDIDHEAANDWSVQTAPGSITWATDDHATDPGAHALYYQTMFNFRFDADRPPAAGSATLGIFKPGIGSNVFVDVQVPANDPTSALAGAQDFALLGNEPNPFSDATELRFVLARRLDVRLTVLDVTGRVIQVLADGTAPAGLNALQWDGRDGSGLRVASGVYFFRLEGANRAQTLKGTIVH